MFVNEMKQWWKWDENEEKMKMKKDKSADDHLYAKYVSASVNLLIERVKCRFVVDNKIDDVL